MDISKKNQWRSTGGQSSTLTDQVVFVSSKTEKNFLLCKKNCNELSSIKRQKMLKCVFLNFRQKSFVDSVSVTRFGFIFSHQKFISKTIFFSGNTKRKKVSSPHYLKNLMKLSKLGISYSLKHDSRTISKMTLYANLRSSPIDTEL